MAPPPGTPEARLLAIARRHGATVVHSDAVTIDGEAFRDVYVDCDDNDTAIAILNDLARDDASYGTKVRAFAERLARFASGDALARRIHRIVRDRIRYDDSEKMQTFRSSDVTLILGIGNCVNTARLMMALALTCGLEARIVGIQPDEDSWHACAQIRDEGGAWRWAECTVAADWDEEPVAAAIRLGLRRRDIRGKQPATVGLHRPESVSI